MEHLRDLRLLDEHGKPLDSRIESVLKRLLRKFLKRFPSLRDDLTVTEVFEAAGRKIANRERETGSSMSGTIPRPSRLVPCQV